jgi:hypothetical protein
VGSGAFLLLCFLPLFADFNQCDPCAHLRRKCHWMNNASHDMPCKHCYNNDKKCERSSPWYLKGFNAELEDWANGIVRKRPSPCRPCVRKSLPAVGPSHGRGRCRAQPSHAPPPQAGPSRFQPPRTSFSCISPVSAPTPPAAPVRAPTPPAAPVRAPSPASALPGPGEPLPPSQVAEPTERLSNDALALLRLEEMHAEGFALAWAGYRASVCRRILVEMELRVAESLQSGSCSSAGGSATPAPAKGKGKGKVSSDDAGPSRDKGKGCAEPQDKDPAPHAPSDDERDFESWGRI